MNGKLLQILFLLAVPLGLCGARPGRVSPVRASGKLLESSTRTTQQITAPASGLSGPVPVPPAPSVTAPAPAAKDVRRQALTGTDPQAQAPRHQALTGHDPSRVDPYRQAQGGTVPPPAAAPTPLRMK